MTKAGVALNGGIKGRWLLCCATLLVAFGFSPRAFAAQGEMGVGIPNFGMYSQATGVSTLVWGLGNASTPIPSGCAYLILSPTTMGMDTYKMAIATMLLAKSSSKPVRFYAHAERDGGCGADYVQLLD